MSYAEPRRGPNPTVWRALSNAALIVYLDRIFSFCAGALESLGGICALQELNLASNALSGSLSPVVISNFSSMVVFCAPFNRLEGTIPSTFSECEMLAVLNLQGNLFCGQIPPALSRCNNLRVIHLYSNRLSGPLPPDLACLDKLVELRLWDNALVGPIPAEWKAMKRLKVLHLSNNLLTGPVSGTLHSSQF